MNARGAAVRGLLWAAVLLVGAVRVTWAQAPPEAIEYYGRDAVGSVRIVFDAQGNVLGRSDYLPFGETWNQSGALPRQRFTGQARDGEAGLDDFNARAYQPLFGRFTRPDPVSGSLFAPQSWNAYAYVQNRPLVFTDPTGMQQVAFKSDVVYRSSVTVTSVEPGVKPEVTWDWWGFPSYYLLGGGWFDEFANFGGGTIGIGGPLRPSTADGDVVVGDTGNSGNGKSGNTGTSTGTGTGDDGQKKKQEEDKKNDPCQAEAKDAPVVFFGASLFGAALAALDVAGGVFVIPSTGRVGVYATGGLGLGLGWGGGLGPGMVRGFKNFVDKNLHLQGGVGPVTFDAYKTPDNRQFTGSDLSFGKPAPPAKWAFALGVTKDQTKAWTIRGGTCGK